MRTAAAALLALAALACSNKTTPPAEPGVAPAAETAASGAECATDADCAVARYPDPAASGGCCEGLCDRPVVTRAEADRRQSAWEAACRAVRCAGACSDDEAPQAACTDGRCVAR